MATSDNGFKLNVFYERLLDIRWRDRKTFEGLSPATRLALAEYERGKRQAAVDAEARGDGPRAV